ncbi:hypothetical protein [Nocardioides ferulae]|uniref:hypothetical protein n=1 Tax=Nocardioides ferulae TaxID=2340821 RepID=UPI000EB1D65F|nr:hypothetical protein [Nocardioides ferulae]
MRATVLAAVAGLLGGGCWVGGALLEEESLHWAGLALLALALAAAGTRLVSSSAGWLQALVAVAFPLLVWSVLEVVRDGLDADPAVDGVAGGAAMLIAVAGLVRARAASRAAVPVGPAPQVPAPRRAGSRRATRRDRGTHAH